jgi:TRAP-type C4-dicarboxylate transport system substrate-binding protein
MHLSRRSLMGGLAAVGLAGQAHAAEHTLRFGSINSSGTPAFDAVLVPFARALEAGSGGKVEVALKPLGGYGKPVDLFPMVEKGEIEIAGTVQGYHPGRFPQSSVMELPLMYDTAVAGTRVMNGLLKEGLLEADYASVKVLALYVLPPYGIFSATKPIAQLRDLRGMRVRAPSTTVGMALARMGMIPLGVPLNLIGESLAGKTVDAITYGWDSLTTTKGLGDKALVEQVSVLVDANFAAPALMVVMNRAAFDRLGPELQAVVEREAQGLAMASARLRDAAEAATKKQLAADGRYRVVTLSEAQRAEMEKLIAPAVGDWKAGLAKQGIDGEKLYARARALGQQMRTAAQ